MTASAHNASRPHSLRCHIAAAALILLSTPLLAFAQGLVVSPGGTASYSYPLAIPPGIAGVVPHLALAHDGRSVNGPVGIGWSLQGTSVITRCHGLMAIDGSARRGVANVPDDKLCLDGQRLIQVDAAGTVVNFPQTNDSLGLASGSREYRTEKDSFARIRAYGIANGSTGNGPAYFKVWTKSGQIYEYGTNANTTANATVTARGGSVVIAWAVSRISDLRGNYADFQYEQREVVWGSGGSTPTAGREWNLMEVRYTGTVTKAPFAKVALVYEERPGTAPMGQAHDRAEAYVLGAKHVSARRLAKVQTFTNTDTTPLKVKTFKLTYGNGPASNRSRLEQIAECAGASESPCLPPTRFEYETGGTLNYRPSAAFQASALATLTMHSTPPGGQPSYIGEPPPVKYGVLTGDFNGDGRTDILRWSDDPAQNRLYFSTGNGGFAQSASFDITDQNFLKSDTCYSSRVADFNGDGLADILRHRNERGAYLNYEGGTHPCPAGTNELYLSKGNGSFLRKPVTGVILDQALSMPTIEEAPGDPGGDKTGWTRGATYYLLDANGDGLLDIVTTVLPFQPLSLTEPDNPCATVVCTRVFAGDGQGGFAEIPTNMAYRTLYSAPNGGYTTGSSSAALGQPSHVNDVDGDGLPDITDAGAFGQEVGHDQPRAFRSRGDGNFDERPYAQLSCPYPFDFNGDGRSDCLRPTPGLSYLSVADGTGALQAVSHNFPFPLQEQVSIGGRLKLSANITPADVDGDGRHDLIRWHDDPTKNTVFLANGDGTFRESTSFNLKTANDRLQKSDDTISLITGDFTGRGHTEILRVMASPTAGAATANQLYLRGGGAMPPDQLKAVVTPTGARTSLTWVPLSDPTSGSLGLRYASDRGTANAASFPSFDNTAPVYVVASVVADSGVGSGQVATEYSYFGMKARHGGRGGLGFREVREQRPGANGSPLTRVSRFLQSHPYVGLVSVNETWVGGLSQTSPPVINRTSVVHCDKTAAAGAETVAQADAPCPTSAKVQRPYAYKKTDETWDPAATTSPPIATVITTSILNNTGDPTQVTVSTAGSVAGLSQTFTKTTNNVFKPDVTTGDSWILGKVERSTIQSSVPNHLAGIAAGAGTSAHATAIAGSGPTQFASISNVSFDTVSLGSSSTRTATITSNGPAALTITVPNAASVSGPDFSFASTSCSSSLAPGASCTVSVTFTPTVTTSRSGSLAVSTGAGTLTASMSGSGLGSTASVQGNAQFGSNAFGSAIANRSVTVTNTGNAPLTLSASGHASPFALVSNSCSGVAAGATCSITYSMASSTIGSSTQNITLSGASTGVVNAVLSGTVTGSIAAITAGDLSFVSTPYGAAAPTKTLSVRNDGNAAMTISALSGLGAPFGISSNNCSAVASGASCSIVVTMATSTIGSWSQTASTTGASVNASRTASGSITGSVATLTSAGGLGFGTVGFGSAAPQQSWTFRNDGNASMNLSPGALNSPFGFVSNGCSAVAAGASCSITAQMSTTSVGTYSQTAIAVSGAAQGNRADLSLGGTVSGSIASVQSNAAFGSNSYGSAITNQSVTVRNTGNAPMSLSASGHGNPFALVSNGCSGIAAGATCSIVYSMASSTIGTATQSITLSGASTGTVSASLSGTVTGSIATLTAGDLAFAATAYGVAAPARTLSLRNDGNTAMTISGLSGLSAPFSISSNSCTGVAAGASCSIVVAMATSAIGSWSQTTASTGSSLGVSIPASGSVTGSIATIVSGDLAFGGVTLDSAVPTRSLTIRNDGNASMTLTGLSGLGAPFSLAGNTCASVPAGSTCTMALSMGTSGNGSWAQTLTTAGATLNATASTSGSVSGSIATFTSTEVGPSLNLGTVAAGAAAPWGTWWFRNDGNAPLALALGTLNSPFSQFYNSCNGISPGSTCYIRAQMATSATGTFSQSGITVTGAARGNRSDFALTGTVIPSTTTITGSPTSLGFGTVPKCAAASRTLTVTNTGAVAATNFGYSFSIGANAQGNFYVAGGTCVTAGSISPNTSCTITVTYAAEQSGGNHNGNFSLSGNFPTLVTPLTAATSSSGSCQ